MLIASSSKAYLALNFANLKTMIMINTSRCTNEFDIIFILFWNKIVQNCCDLDSKKSTLIKIASVYFFLIIFLWLRFRPSLSILPRESSCPVNDGCLINNMFFRDWFIQNSILSNLRISSSKIRINRLFAKCVSLWLLFA